MTYKIKRYLKLVVITFLLYLFSSCNHKKNAPVLFQVLDHNTTGLDFSNVLKPTKEFNVFKYMYFYNGSGVGAGDFNNDGLIDLFFSANQGNNKIYLNQGKLKFKDVTAEAKIPEDGAWSTGVSVVDINNDGLLDIYICRVGDYETLHSKNQLLICQGIDKNGVPFYKDEAHEYGLDFSGFSTQAVFFDYDGDGDLDMFLLNHSVHQNGTFAPRNNFLGTYNVLSGDRLYRNDGNNKFTDVTKESAINSSAISYGLGIGVSDIDLDGWPDLYVGNDFHENDYLYINQHNGTFKEDLTNRIMHTSQFSMGVDIADINNDAYPDIISMDMLPSDRTILKSSLGEDEYNTFYMKIGYGYNYQYTRNNLQLNRRNGMFSETGLYSGVAASDWSWSPLWMDFDNDGLKDLFISNGIPKRLNDMDYVNYISDDEIQQKLRENVTDEKDLGLIKKFPEIKLPNKFFKNEGDVKFADIGDEIGDNRPTFSNGAIYADLDNDGDLDVVVNNLEDPALIYENKSNDAKNKPYIDIKLTGSAKNINALGAKVIVYDSNEIRTYEKYPVRGFQSSMEIPIHIGLYKTKVDSILLIWPDNTYQTIDWQNNISRQIKFQYHAGLPKYDYSRLTNHWKNPGREMVDITKNVNLNFKPEENPFNEFDREPLIPFMVSREGPALAVGDASGDGLDDVFIGSSKGNKSAIFFQRPGGKFEKSDQPGLDSDSTYEDVDAAWVDVNNDGTTDLVIASGGNEYYGNDKYQQPRLYLNDGHEHFTLLDHAFDNIYLTASCVVPYDFNGDGYADLFIGGRAVPWEYGQVPQSYLLENDKQGHFKDVTAQYSSELSKVGFVRSALWFDINKDGRKDLIISPEWGEVCAFINENGSFKKQLLTDKKGWWNFTLPVDVNGDGNIDLIAGNEGLNNRLTASSTEPVRLYFNDFDDNGKKEQVLTYYLDGHEIPFANKDELQKQIPVIKKRFLYASDFAKASLDEIFSADKLKNASVLTADYFSNSILMNKGNLAGGKAGLNFATMPLPWLAQLSPYKDAVVVNANNDSLPDILMVGNFYDNNIQMGRNDADFGTILINKGNGQFDCESINGLQIKGEVRHIKKINIGREEAYILARNNDSVMVIKFKDDSPFKKRDNKF
ncbi:VCBS repeat-containing protein [Ginsengibacter hankyongi]|uniref:VCBS repeat-containing protein n=1 Tax=Ginsengibacter hankyongi TaxID=2607284 RepID=A0A5J5IG03_9BACT|nr:VCBS repeat-containing protein [Ginsengibacter hankyongi]KAA9038175.1 VCBS repeat-containing protein [Ginsengibacter hankyongi]